MGHPVIATRPLQTPAPLRLPVPPPPVLQRRHTPRQLELDLRPR